MCFPKCVPLLLGTQLAVSRCRIPTKNNIIYLIVKKPTFSNSGNTTQKFKRSSVTVALKLDTDGLKSVNLMDLSLICISSETVFLTFALIFNFQPKFQQNSSFVIHYPYYPCHLHILQCIFCCLWAGICPYWIFFIVISEFLKPLSGEVL